jgi:hypothetical protein
MRISIWLHQLFFFFFNWRDWGLNWGLCACKAGTLLLEPQLQSILLWLFWRWGSRELFALGGLKPWSLLNSASQTARITGVSHCILIWLVFKKWDVLGSMDWPIHLASLGLTFRCCREEHKYPLRDVCYLRMSKVAGVLLWKGCGNDLRYGKWNFPRS